MNHFSRFPLSRRVAALGLLVASLVSGLPRSQTEPVNPFQPKRLPAVASPTPLLDWTDAIARCAGPQPPPEPFRLQMTPSPSGSEMPATCDQVRLLGIAVSPPYILWLRERERQEKQWQRQDRERFFERAKYVTIA